MANNDSHREPMSSMTRRSFLATTGMALGAGMAGAQSANDPSVERAKIEAEDRRTRNRTARALKAKGKGNGLNLIVIVADTWRTDHLGCYGSQRAKTPHLDEFARNAVVFERSYADGLPTLPARRVYHTGKSVIPGSQWMGLPAGEVTLAQILGKHGYWSGLLCDVYHYFAPDMNLHVGFDNWQWIRGQEHDPYLGGPREKFQPKAHMPADLWSPSYDPHLRQYLMNTQYRKGEDDYFCAQTTRAAMDWLEQNATNRPFMLWIEMFDPHEPWDPPPRFAKMYRDDYGYDRFLFGYGVQNAKHKPDFTPHLPVIRDLYRSEVTFSDHCIGRLLERIEQLGLLDDTVIAFTSDHGTHLGEFGQVQKQAALLNSCLTHLPLIIRHPERSTAGTRVPAIVSAMDYAPTFCSLLGIEDPAGMHGQNLWPLVTGKVNRLRDRAFTQYGQFASLRTDKWHYFQGLQARNPGLGPMLCDLTADPGEQKNVLAAHPEVAAELRQCLCERHGCELPKPVVKG